MEPSQFDTRHLNKICEKIEHKAKWFQERSAYVSGLNPVIFQELPKPAPDYRIAAPLARKAVQQYSGYMVKPDSITYTGDFYENVAKDIFNYNDEAMVTALEFDSGLAYGVCYELHWTDKNGTEKNFYMIPAEQCYPVYSNDLRKRLVGFYWSREIEDENDKEVYLLTYWDDKFQYDFSKPEGAKEWTLDATIPHPYGEVPINIGHISRDKTNIFDHVKDRIDFYDKLFSSDIANESQKYSNALLLLAQKIDDQTEDEMGRKMIDRLKEIGVMDGLGEDPGKQAAYLIKDIPTDFIKFACEETYDKIHDLLPMIDTRDDTLGSQSGIAIKYKLLPFEQKCSSIEAVFTQFLYKRLRLIAAVTKALGGSDEGVDKVSIKWTRNLPENETEVYDNASKMVGFLPDEDIIHNVFPDSMLKDKEEVLKRMAANKPEVTMPDAGADAAV